MKTILFIFILFIFIGCGYKTDPVYVSKKSEIRK